MNFRGYTSLMSPEAMRLPYLETLLSWSRMCESISVCYSTFPKLNLKVPEGAIVPWEDDGSREILEKFNREMLGNKVKIVDHVWNPDEPREDGFTKQLARANALSSMGNDPLGWAIQFDADEILRDGDEVRFMQECLDDNDQPIDKRKPFALAGILELFGDMNKVRFGFGNWIKIRATRNIPELFHGLPLRMGDMAVRARNPRTGKLIALDNRDDAAGFISSLSFTRPDYNMGIWLFNPSLLQMVGQAQQIPVEHRVRIWPQINQALAQDLDASGIWMFHTGWADIARKWRMGWYFDNFWSVLSGKQDTFIEKAEVTGSFTHTRCPSEKDLPAELAKEKARPEIQSLPTTLVIPSVFEQVANWRTKSGL